MAVARMGVQAAEALNAAHEIGVVHRDVKPSNLLLDEKGKVWVTDFGVARCKSGGSLTETGHVLGSMPYMSPEQALGQPALVDHRTDVYSLGVTLYELATLRHPCEGTPQAATAEQYGRSQWRQPRSWNSSIPVDFENIVLKAMAEARDERYATARELAEDLRRFLEGRPILARRPSLSTRLEKWARRHKRPVAAAMGVLAAGGDRNRGQPGGHRVRASRERRGLSIGHREPRAGRGKLPACGGEIPPGPRGARSLRRARQSTAR